MKKVVYISIFSLMAVFTSCQKEVIKPNLGNENIEKGATRGSSVDFGSTNEDGGESIVDPTKPSSGNKTISTSVANRP